MIDENFVTFSVFTVQRSLYVTSWLRYVIVYKQTMGVVRLCVCGPVHSSSWFCVVGKFVYNYLRFIMNANSQKSSSIGHREPASVVPYVPLRIDDAQPIDGGIKQLLKHIRPEWPTEHIQFKVLKSPAILSCFKLSRRIL